MPNVIRKNPGRVPATFALVGVLVVVALAIFLLYRVQSNAGTINGEAAVIAKSGRGINTDTDAVMQLNQTNAMASSILKSAQPLQGELGQIVNLAGSINGTADSINGSAVTVNRSAKSINGSAGSINNSATSINNEARSINGSAGAINADANSINGSAVAVNNDASAISGSAAAINGTAKGINGTAAAILNVAGSILRGVNLINTNLDQTIIVAGQIFNDANSIIGQAVTANHEAACIDQALGAPSQPGCAR